MQQAKRISTAPTRGYEETALVRAEQQLAEAQRKLTAVRRWATSGAWVESGSDGLYAALGET